MDDSRSFQFSGEHRFRWITTLSVIGDLVDDHAVYGSEKRVDGSDRSGMEKACEIER